MRNAGTGGPEACRVVATSQNLSAKLTALAVIEGTCLDVALSAPFSPSQAAAESAEGIPGSSGSTRCETATANLGVLHEEAVQQQKHVQQQRRQNNGATICSREAENKVVVEEPWEVVITDQGCTSASAVSMMSGTSSSSGELRGRMPPPSAPPLLAKPPVRGFHLVDLHAVVRNSVEWRHRLPKVC